MSNYLPHELEAFGDADELVLAAVIFAGCLGLLAAAIVGHVLLTGSEKKLNLPRMGSLALSSVWVLLVVGMLAFLVARVAPGLSDSPTRPATAQHQMHIELGKPTESEPLDSNVGKQTNAGDGRTLTPEETPEASGEDSKPAAVVSKVPDWIRQTAVEQGDAMLLVVRGDPKIDIQDAEQAALDVAVEIIRDDFHKLHGDKGSWSLPHRLVSGAIRRRYVEPMPFSTSDEKHSFQINRVHLQIELSPELRKEIYPVWRAQVVQHRLWSLGGLFGLVTLILGTTAAYLRLDRQTSGTYRKRLKLAAVSLIVAGGVVVVTTV